MYIVPQNCAPYRPSLFPRLRVSSYMCILTIKGILFYSILVKLKISIMSTLNPHLMASVVLLALAYVLLIS